MELCLAPSALPQRLKSFLRDQGLSGTYWKKLKPPVPPGERGNHPAGSAAPAGRPGCLDLSAGTLHPGTGRSTPVHPGGNGAVSGCGQTGRPGDPQCEERNGLRSQPPGGWYFQTHHISSAVHPVSRLDRETSGVVLFAKTPVSTICCPGTGWKRPIWL